MTMTPFGYTIIAYALGLGLMWGYALVLWNSCRNEDRRAEADMNARGDRAE